MFNTLIRRLARPSGTYPAREARPRNTHLQLRLPSPYGGKPWVTATLALSSVPRGYGETLRLRVYIDGCIDRTPRGALPHAPANPRSLGECGRRAAAALARGAVEHWPGPPLEGQRWRSWLDIQFSSAPLDAGADALLPEPLRRIYPGAAGARAGLGEPRVGVWAGPAGGPAGGIARLAVLQLDERDLGRKRRANTAPGFNLNASLAQLIEPALVDEEKNTGL